MVHFFGILSPRFEKPVAASEAPHKRSFFGGLPDAAFGSVPMSRAEQDACYLSGAVPSSATAVEREYGGAPRFARFARPIDC
ncbi:hypothetical protein [Devosia sp. 2618]|uniref:hypothetical protein n=1 Tax=Devosia sp. 2618 TaxID=3156454 RepID=UPI00339319A6